MAFEDMVCSYNDLASGRCLRATQGTKFYGSEVTETGAVLRVGLNDEPTDTVPADCWCSFADMVPMA